MDERGAGPRVQGAEAPRPPGTTPGLKLPLPPPRLARFHSVLLGSQLGSKSPMATSASIMWQLEEANVSSSMRNVFTPCAHWMSVD